MKKEIKYITLDGRGKSEEFLQCVLDAVKGLQVGAGLYIIKDFEPFPLYSIMEQKGFEKHLEKKSDEEYHVWFFFRKMRSKILR